MLPKRNTFRNNKSLSKDAPAWQQSASWRTGQLTRLSKGKRFRSFYSGASPTSRFFLVSGILVDCAATAMVVLCGGQLL